MTKEQKLKDLEARQRKLADEIKALREEVEFKRGEFYKSGGLVVVCKNPVGADNECFTGVITEGFSYLEEDDEWVKNQFHRVIPKWLEPWELENPHGIDFSKDEHDLEEIPDKWLCEMWDDNDTHHRVLRFFDNLNQGAFHFNGSRDCVHYDHYRMIPAEEWPQWARDAWRTLV